MLVLYYGKNDLMNDLWYELTLLRFSRQGQAIRLSYDHKGSDAQEAKRITDLGGFMMNNRVNGVLAVTRSLGDSVMKEFVVGNPYTTETILTQGQDDFLILACDGVSGVNGLDANDSLILICLYY